jgi:hypothetical protein
MEPKRLLIVALEYQGYHSKQGAALSRRVKQVADDFVRIGWQVTVIHRDAVGEVMSGAFVTSTEQNGVHRISVKDGQQRFLFDGNSFVRKLRTLYYLLYFGDRYYTWAKNVLKYFPGFGLQSPDLIISFFTPRAPIVIANKLARYYKTKWIADLQDELREGLSSPSSQKVSYVWVRKTLTEATAVVQVSPEWAQQDADVIGKPVATIRHAVALPLFTNAKPDNDTFTVFYGGSLDIRNQSLDLLAKVLADGIGKKIKLVLATSDAVYLHFKAVVGSYVEIEHVGWVSYEKYCSLVAASDCCLVIPWSTVPRKVIPSKFYEICQYNKPTWIVGPDTGAFTSLLAEWGHAGIPVGDVAYQVQALQAALDGDFSKMFNFSTCTKEVVYSNSLAAKFLELI